MWNTCIFFLEPSVRATELWVPMNTLWETAMNNNCGISLDQWFEISGIALEWFKIYLQNHAQSVLGYDLYTLYVAYDGI